MGGKPSHAMPSNRPESGGADKHNRLTEDGKLEGEKNEFAADQKAKEESRPPNQAETAGKKTGPNL